MGIMNEASKLAAAQFHADRQQAAQRQADEREQQANRLAEKWGVPAAYGGVIELMTVEWRSERWGGDRSRIVKRERRDSYLLADEIRVVFLYTAPGSGPGLHLIQDCRQHGQYASALYSRSSTEPGEGMLVAAVAATLRAHESKCPACVAERERATCPTCGHDMSEPGPVR